MFGRPLAEIGVGRPQHERRLAHPGSSRPRPSTASGCSTASGSDLGSDEAKRLAEELEGHRLAVSRDDDTIFVYVASQPEAEQARADRRGRARATSGIEATSSRSSTGSHDEERWADEPRRGDLGGGRARARLSRPGRCGSSCPRTSEADELADQLEGEGYDVVRRWRYLIVGTGLRGGRATSSRKRVHGEVEPGGEVVWEVTPQNPFAIFGGLGG